MLGHDRVRAGRIDHVEITQKRNGQVALNQFRGNVDLLFFGSITKNANLVRGGQHILSGKLLSKKRIQEGRLSRLNFSDNDKEQRLPQIAQYTVNGFEGFGRAPQLCREFEKTRQSSFHFRPKLQVLLGNHGSHVNGSGKAWASPEESLVARPLVPLRSEPEVEWRIRSVFQLGRGSFPCALPSPSAGSGGLDASNS